MSKHSENKRSGYPDPLASTEEKLENSYGLSYGKYIADQWFNGGIISEGCNYYQRKKWVRERRLYSKGKQGDDRYKQIVAREEEDLSFLNLDWRPTNYAGKFVRVVSNGTNQENYTINVSALDRLAGAEREEKQKELKRKMLAKDLLMEAKEKLGIDVMPQGFVPEDDEEIKMFMNIKHRPKCEISEEILINYVYKTNNWHNTVDKVNEDLTVAGIGIVKVRTDKYNGIQLDYIDPEYFVHSHVKDKNFKDMKYAGHVEPMTIGDLQRNGDFTETELRDIAKSYGEVNKISSNYTWETAPIGSLLEHKIDVLHFSFQTQKQTVYKKRKTKHGDFYIRKDENYNPPANRSDYERVGKSCNTWFEGSYVIGTDAIYDYQESENMLTDEMDNAMSDYVVRATDMYEGELNSFVAEIEPTLDQMHYTLLKLQHLIAEIRPNGAQIDIDMLAELEGKTEGKNMSWQEIMALFQTKGIVFTSRVNMGEDGMKDGAAVRPQANGVPANLPHLLEILQDQYQRVRDITGINPFRDGTQNERALVGVQQLAFLQSNVATSHIVNASLDIAKTVAERISGRIRDIFERSNLKKLYERAVGQENLEVVDALKDRSLHEFGFHIQLKPTEQQVRELNEDLSIALGEGLITVDDKIEANDLAKINIKMAKEYIRYARAKKLKEAREEELMRSQAKSQNDMQSALAAQQAKDQSAQVKARLNVWEHREKKRIDVMTTQQLNEVNAPIREQDAWLQIEKENIRAEATTQKTEYVEGEKLKRQNKNNTDHSKMIEQRKRDSGALEFDEGESFADIVKSFQRQQQ